MKRNWIERILVTLLAIGCGGLLGSACSTRDEFTSDPVQNYDALWNILDRHYAYFELKLPKDSTWRDMYHKHRSKITDKTTGTELFAICSDLLSELRDGHVNLTSTFDYARYWAWRDDAPRNFSEELVEKYLGRDYHIAGGLSYRILEYNRHEEMKFGYIRYGSFSSSVSHAGMNSILARFKDCRAIIFDIRHNGGGNVSNSDLIASHFMRLPRVVGKTRYKTSPLHDGFSPYREVRVDTLEAGLRWLRPVVLLTNRGVYSAANDFTLKMKGLPLVTVMGDSTGGGGGLPMTSELPNGWSVRFSSTQTIDNEGREIELGIAPDYKLALSEASKAQGVDSMIEDAIVYLVDRYKKYEETKVWEK